MSPLYRKAAILALLIAAFSVGMAYLLITFKVSGAHRELRHSRFDLTASEIDQLVEKSFSVGMALDELSAVPDLLQRRKLADGAIRAIDIATAQGSIAYSTDPRHIGQDASSDWRRAWTRRSGGSAATGGRWRATASDEAVAGTTLVNSFDEIQGYVAVRYSIAENLGMQAQLRASLAPIAGMAFAATSVTLFIVLAFFAWRFEKATKAAATQLNETRCDPTSGGWGPLIDALNARFDAAHVALKAWASSTPAVPK